MLDKSPHSVVVVIKPRNASIITQHMGSVLNTENLTVLLCTRNRWLEVEDTLTRLRALELDRCPIIIADDGSDVAWPAGGTSWRGGLKFLGFEERAGLVSRRNDLMRACGTPFALVIDDDSNPIADELAESFRLFRDPRVAVVAFPVRKPCGQWQVPPSKNGKRHKAFTGCAHMLRTQPFFNVGGYRDELVHQGEEMDLGFRLFLAGFSCVHSESPIFEHRLVQTARSYERMDYYGTRNELFFADWYSPKEIRAARIARTLLKRVAFFLREQRVSILQGIVAWMSLRRNLAKYRCRVTISAWREYQILPY
jgi:hypothetical protein